jgi:hypothetical protein
VDPTCYKASPNPNQMSCTIYVRQGNKSLIPTMHSLIYCSFDMQMQGISISVEGICSMERPLLANSYFLQILTERVSLVRSHKITINRSITSNVSVLIICDGLSISERNSSATFRNTETRPKFQKHLLDLCHLKMTQCRS